MLCVRCGMDSSTTDVCEWCKRPFLPPGAKVSSPSRRLRPGERVAPEGESESAPAPPPPLGAETEAPAAPLVAGAEEEMPAPASPAASTSDEVLRPLGSQVSRTPADSTPFPGTGRAGAGASVDVSQYMGTDQSIFRPIERSRIPGGSAFSASEGLAARRRAAIEREQGPEIPENIRLLRAAIAGGIVALVVTMVQFAVKHEVPQYLIGGMALPIAKYKEWGGALLYGAATTVLLGFMLSALLVNRKWGAPMGLILGLLLGLTALSGNMPWNLIAGGLAGLVSGTLAAKGMRRVINV